MLAYNFDITEVKEFSVQEISNKIKTLLEENLGLIRIKGEISGLKIATSGHVYFNLKDNFAVLSCICWRHAFSRVKFELIDGLEVVIMGKITSYPGQSKYQLSVETIDPSGLGAMMQILNERKERLGKEGLFDQINKKPIPFMPRKVGIITSLTGAVIQDIIHRIKNRCGANVIIWPSLVQGEAAAKQICAGIEEFNKLGVNAPDVIILARGGGSIEDLWCFNEEEVVRAIINSKIPTISAIGHETDYTLADFAADLRAPTPTAAAEFISPLITDLKCNLQILYSNLIKTCLEKLKYHTQTIKNYSKTLEYSLNYTDLVMQKIDELGFRLIDSLPNLLKFKTANLARFNTNAMSPNKIINYNLLKLIHQEKYLGNVTNNLFARFSNQLNLVSHLLQSLDYNNVLKRGYAIIESQNGKFLTSKNNINEEDKFNIRFWDGKISVRKY